MRKNFLLIATLCICGTFANANTHRFAANNAAQNASPFNTSFVGYATDNDDELEQIKKRYEETTRRDFNAIPDKYKTLYDQSVIDEYIDKIRAGEKKYEVDETYREAHQYILEIEKRKDAISEIEERVEGTPQKDIVMYLIERMLKSDDVYNMTQDYNIAIAIINANKVQKDAITHIRQAMGDTTGIIPYFYNLVSAEIEGILDAGEDNRKISDLEKAAVDKLNAAVPHYMACMSAVLGTLGTPQKGPAIEVTDQNNVVIKLYNPKNAKLIEVK